MNEGQEKLVDSIISRLTDSDATRETDVGGEPADLAALGAESVDALEQELELAAAAAALAFAQQHAEPMPASMRQRLAEAASLRAASNVTPIGRAARPQPAPAPRRGALFATAGWAAAAMLLVVLVVGTLREPGLDAPDPATQRLALLERPATIRSEWAPPDVAEFSGVTGDVVWNDDEQSGFLRLTGMPANDPSVAQYQLWIVDPDRDANPVDGGVFDIPAASGEVIIPINAKLAVDDPAAFAITREKPGGVVVSGGPLLVVASTG
jgi:hypothetical protein